MDFIQFSGLSPETHVCQSIRQDDWIIWRCARCNGYERKYNWKTGEMRVRRGGSDAQHTGSSDKASHLEALAEQFPLN